ncbi:MAG: hypothetical protein COV38_09730 [Bdellovibrionales bacterium CG11_big_fil_rev_8_21_14_0_20_38_13]|nr:MAG: hypothetical protein COV38_09730 [Bdellovibrionales bacterium CG11_big_fil_rev_8_21_14_0_20_38_13]
MNNRAFFLLTWNTVQKELRSKSFYMVIAITIGMLVIGYSIMQAFREQIQVEGGPQMLGNGQLFWIYYAFINAWSVFLALLFGLGCVRSDISSNVIGQLLAFPINRTWYLISRVLGSWLLVGFYQLLSFLLTAVLFFDAIKEIPVTAMILAPMISLLPTLAAVILGLFVSLWVGKAPGMILTGLAAMGGSWARSVFADAENAFANLSLLKVVGLILWIVIPRFAAPHSIVQNFAEMANTEIAWVDISQFGVATVMIFIITNFVFKRRGF